MSMLQLFINLFFDETLHQFITIDGSYKDKEKSVANVNESTHAMLKTQDSEDSRWCRLYDCSMNF